jgi:hypothetical protein
VSRKPRLKACVVCVKPLKLPGGRGNVGRMSPFETRGLSCIHCVFGLAGCLRQRLRGASWRPCQCRRQFRLRRLSRPRSMLLMPPLR